MARKINEYSGLIGLFVIIISIVVFFVEVRGAVNSIQTKMVEYSTIITGNTKLTRRIRRTINENEIRNSYRDKILNTNTEVLRDTNEHLKEFIIILRSNGTCLNQNAESQGK